MSIRLQKIDIHNWEAAIDLKVSEDHNEFVAPNVYSIAQAQFYPDVTAYGIFHHDTMIGFAMYGVVNSDPDEQDDDDNDNRFWIWRLMIDEDYRFKGFGKEAMNLIIQEAKDKNYPCVVLSTEPENHKGIKFYESLGFKATGKIEDGEEEYILTF